MRLPPSGAGDLEAGAQNAYGRPSAYRGTHNPDSPSDKPGVRPSGNPRRTWHCEPPAAGPRSWAQPSPRHPGTAAHPQYPRPTARAPAGRTTGNTPARGE